jgi:pimeloyl-ACP methyl ester carboxylesterase
MTHINQNVVGRLRSGVCGSALVCIAAGFWNAPSIAQSAGPLTIDHYVTRETEIPAAAGQQVALYVRERVLAGTLARGQDFDGNVVLFVHGAGTPAEVAFDVPYGDYSWMAHHASAGFDVFSVDVTGYGRSTRPGVMHDPCNLSVEQRGGLSGVDCDPSYGYELGNIESDWNDIDAVVEYIFRIRNVDRLSLVGWSLGGPRAGGYAARNPDKVERIVLLAPAYSRQYPAARPADYPPPGPAITKQSAADFISNWDRQVGCEGQYQPAVAHAIWADMLASDPVGATWGTGVRRAPRTTVWGWGEAAVSRMRTPMLIVQGAHDAQVTPDRARDLYADLGSSEKVYIDMGCASHNAMWEEVHGLMFDASLEWLSLGTVGGTTRGELRMGY